MGLSENMVYSQWNSHLIGIMISKTIGFRGLAYFQTHPYHQVHADQRTKTSDQVDGLLLVHLRGVFFEAGTSPSTLGACGACQPSSIALEAPCLKALERLQGISSNSVAAIATLMTTFLPPMSDPNPNPSLPTGPGKALLQTKYHPVKTGSLVFLSFPIENADCI